MNMYPLSSLVLLLPNSADIIPGGSEGAEEVVQGHLGQVPAHPGHLSVAVVAVEG